VGWQAFRSCVGEQVGVQDHVWDRCRGKGEVPQKNRMEEWCELY
jgi:hypothetical protein